MIEISRNELKKLYGGIAESENLASCEEECPTEGSKEGCSTGKTCKKVPCGDSQTTLLCK